MTSFEFRWPAVDLTRVAALTAVAVALGSSLQVMYHLIDVVGLPTRFLAVVLVSLLGATALARAVTVRTAVLVGAVTFAGGLTWYFGQIAVDPAPVAVVTDVLDLLGGRTVLRISNVRAWVLGVAPAPVFLIWFFAVRRRYVPAVAVAGAALSFFVLTGDADAATTVTGAVAGAGALGIGETDLRGESVARAEPVLVTVAVMIAVPAVVSVVPATTGVAGALTAGGGGEETLEAGLANADEDVRVQGRISLSPTVRFAVESDSASYWRIGSYDRYTGDGWVRTGGSRAYESGETLRDPIGTTRQVEQRVRVESRSGVMPAAWKPVRVTGLDGVRVRTDGSLAPNGQIERGTTYRVVSSVPAASPRELQAAGTDYPDAIQREYTQLPESTPDRVERRTSRLTADAETPYETARVVERYLENSKNYSLAVDRPRGDVADAFLFEMDAGYCTYFATTMVTMLRTQDVPARFVAGYTSGERVAEDEWVVRGLDAHAWVEVYFPEQGWVRFDPTPSGPRTQVEQAAVEQTRDGDPTGVDTNDTGTPNDGTTPSVGTDAPVDQSTPARNGSEERTRTPAAPFVVEGANQSGAQSGPASTAGDWDLVPSAPTRQQLGLGIVALAGTLVGVRRSGLGRRAYRAVWLRYQPRSDPAADVERAYQRLEHHLERRHRERRPGETVRAFLDAVDADEDARRVAAIRERSRYGGSADAADADEAVRLVNGLVR